MPSIVTSTPFHIISFLLYWATVSDSSLAIEGSNENLLGSTEPNEKHCSCSFEPALECKEQSIDASFTACKILLVTSSLSVAISYNA